MSFIKGQYVIVSKKNDWHENLIAFIKHIPKKNIATIEIKPGINKDYKFDDLCAYHGCEYEVHNDSYGNKLYFKKVN